MKIKNAIQKAKAKAKAKVAAKCGKGCKCAKAAKAAVALLLFAALGGVAGCLAPGDMQQPSRSQTMRNDFSDCNFYFAGMPNKDGTFEAVEGWAAPALEMFTQAQASEGSETVTPTATSKPSMTIDTDAAFDIPVNKANSGTSAAGGAAEKLLGAGADWLSGKLGGTATAPAANAAQQTATASAACADGSCSPGGACTDCQVK